MLSHVDSGAHEAAMMNAPDTWKSRMNSYPHFQLRASKQDERRGLVLSSMVRGRLRAHVGTSGYPH